MTPQTILCVAGEPSGDQLAAELVRALAAASGPVPPRFFGAGGPAMAAAGVEVTHDLTRRSVIGPADALRQYAHFRRAFDELLLLAARRVPDIVLGVDFGAFNLRLAEAVRRRSSARSGPFRNWRPRIVQFVSPQVWASRPGRARRIARTHDLLLSILPFEPGWYASHAPAVPVQFVGHPLVDRHGGVRPEPSVRDAGRPPRLVLLPGSRAGELRRHWPVVAAAATRACAVSGAMPVLVLASEEARAWLPPHVASPPGMEVRVGDLAGALRGADAAIASTGTVTLECAWFCVPTVALYRTDRFTYEVGRRLVTVRHLAMPNLLAGREVMPEFIQDAATPEALSTAVIRLLGDSGARDSARRDLAAVSALLGPPGACARAARSILELPR